MYHYHMLSLHNPIHHVTICATLKGAYMRLCFPFVLYLINIIDYITLLSP
jgi:hypothetical protein